MPTKAVTATNATKAHASFKNTPANRLAFIDKKVDKVTNKIPKSTSIVPQFIFSEVEEGDLQAAFVAIEKEPWIIHWVQVAHNVGFASGRVAFGAHYRHLVAFARHIYYYHSMTERVTRPRGIDKHIAWHHFAYFARLSLAVHRKSAANAIRITQKSIQCLARAATAVLQRFAIHIAKANFGIAPLTEKIFGT